MPSYAFNRSGSPPGEHRSRLGGLCNIPIILLTLCECSPERLPCLVEYLKATQSFPRPYPRFTSYLYKVYETIPPLVTSWYTIWAKVIVIVATYRRVVTVGDGRIGRCMEVTLLRGRRRVCQSGISNGQEYGHNGGRFLYSDGRSTAGVGAGRCQLRGVGRAGIGVAVTEQQEENQEGRGRKMGGGRTSEHGRRPTRVTAANAFPNAKRRRGAEVTVER